MIHVELGKPPPNVHPFGAPGGMPSTTLYLDPAMQRAGAGVGVLVLVMVLLPLAIAVVGGVATWALSAAKDAKKAAAGVLRPFPATCDDENSELELSGNYEGDGPLVEVTTSHCTIRIKGSRLKGTTLVKGRPSELDIRLEDVTVETTETLLDGRRNTRLYVKGGKLSAPATVLAGAGLDVELDGATLESTDGSAIRDESSLALKATNATIRGKTTAIEGGNGTKIVLRGATTVVSDDIAIQGTSLDLDAQGGKIEGIEAAIVDSLTPNIKTRDTVIIAKERAIVVKRGRLSFTGGSVTSLASVAIANESPSTTEIALAGATVKGVEAAVGGEHNMKIRATKKARLIATSGNAVDAGGHLEMNLDDATVEAAAIGVKAGMHAKLRLTNGSSIKGARAGVHAENNLTLDMRDATIEGGSGHAVKATFNARITATGTLRGKPAIELSRQPISLDLSAARVDGEQIVPRR
jgi:hypothetical protein